MGIGSLFEQEVGFRCGFCLCMRNIHPSFPLQPAHHHHSSPIKKAEELKDLGNKAFSAGKFAEAIEHFTEAISMDSSNHVLFSNRSAAFASLKKYREALNDAEKTVSLKADWAKVFACVRVRAL